MSILGKFATGVAGNVAIKIGRRIARDLAKFKEGYIAGYSDAKAGKSPKYK